MNNSQLAHLWANQSRRSARGSNFFFEGEVIYSYGAHFPIARLFTAGKRQVCFFTSRGYSSSTARHKSYARRALKDSVTVFEVPRISATSQTEHKVNHDALVSNVAFHLEKAARASKYASYHLADAKKAMDAANLYRSLFYKRGKLLSKPKNWAKMVKEAGVRRREIELKQAEAAKARLAKQAEIEREQLAEWLSGNPINRYLSASPVHFRLKPGQPEVIQTTKGAEFPLDDGKAALRFIQECRKQSRAFESNGRQVIVGDFRIDRIDESGNVIAGCHRVHWEQIEEFARQIGVLS